MTDKIKDEIATHLPWMIRYATSLSRNQDDGEDLAMESYLKAITTKGEYDPTRGASVRGWLAIIIESKAIDRSRRGLTKNGRSRTITIEDPLFCGSTEYDGEDENFRSWDKYAIAASTDPWNDVNSAIVGDEVLSVFSDEELDVLKNSTRISAEKNGTDRWASLRRKKALAPKLKARATRIMGLETND